ncbi:MAG: alcohol dehydrogenase catalytic domain-containing protein [Chloroflexi bacterium]|nr:alcohol dehydrogenase catalytic domain-containing protein [Chloroflexota bacterium]
MQALVNYSDRPGSVELREVPEPKPGRGQVLIRVRAVGVCGSDLHQWHGPVSWQVNYPVILGHEFAGTIAAVGEDVHDWQVGDRVACETAAEICGKCIYCHTGQYNVCPERKGFGYGVDGAMATYVVARQELLHRIPDGVSFEEAALTEPASVAFNAIVEKSRPRPGDLVVILGPGPIGLMALQVIRLFSPAHVLMVGLARDEARLALAEKLGADQIIVADREDPVPAVRSLGDGLGADLVIDAVGVRETLRQSLEMVRPNGQITKIGWGREPVNFSLDPLIAKAATLQGTFSHTWPTWERVLGLMAHGQIDARSISETFPLADWHAAFQRMDSLAIAKAVLIPG